MDCTPKCRKAKHSDLNFSAVLNIGQDAAKVQSILPRLCANFARVTDQCGRNALHLAASCGKCDILEWLVKEQGADLNSKDEESGWTSLHRSLFYGYLDCAVKLIQVFIFSICAHTMVCSHNGFFQTSQCCLVLVVSRSKLSKQL